MSFDVNILVNGSRCKQYCFNGRKYIEAKKGSEYVIEIRNHSWERILAVCSVDGLDILTGKTAIEDGAGYVLNPYDVGKYDGFRISDDKVAKFVFDYKNASYAASKGDGSERNVGVIGIRLFNEKVPPPPPPVEIHNHYHNYPPNSYAVSCSWSAGGLYGPGRYGYVDPAIYTEETLCDTGVSGACPPPDYRSLFGGMAGGTSCAASPGVSTQVTDNSINMNVNLSNMVEDHYIPVRETDRSSLRDRFNRVRTTACNAYTRELVKESFDMGTKFGEAKVSRVIEVEFEKNLLMLSTEIFYASRQSLIDMGVPIGCEKQVSFPESFADNKYAKPPAGWRG